MKRSVFPGRKEEVHGGPAAREGRAARRSDGATDDTGGDGHGHQLLEQQLAGVRDVNLRNLWRARCVTDGVPGFPGSRERVKSNSRLRKMKRMFVETLEPSSNHIFMTPPEGSFQAPSIMLSHLPTRKPDPEGSESHPRLLHPAFVFFFAPGSFCVETHLFILGALTSGGGGVQPSQNQVLKNFIEDFFLRISRCLG